MTKQSSPYLRFIQRTGATRHPGGLLATDNVLKRCDLDETSIVLDVGCGAGHTAVHIAQNYGCKVVGVDISSEAILRAHDLYKREACFEQLSFLTQDILHLSYPDESFDVVLCESVLIFVVDKKTALNHMSRLVKPGGFLIINELCQNDSDKGDECALFFAHPDMGGHLVKSKDFTESLNDDFALIISDEKPFSLTEQLKADIKQWGNFRGLIQLLEAGYKVALHKDMQADVMSLLNLIKVAPRSLISGLNQLTLLAQKTTHEHKT